MWDLGPSNGGVIIPDVIFSSCFLRLIFSCVFGLNAALFLNARLISCGMLPGGTSALARGGRRVFRLRTMLWTGGFLLILYTCYTFLFAASRSPPSFRLRGGSSSFALGIPTDSQKGPSSLTRKPSYQRVNFVPSQSLQDEVEEEEAQVVDKTKDTLYRQSALSWHYEMERPRNSIVGNDAHDDRDAPAAPLNYDLWFHLDLKGAPPKVSFLKDVMSLAKSVGHAGFLMEWEDMFPYTGKLKNAVAGNHYSLEDVRNLLSHAKSIGLKVIPLVQSLGHMEFVLKHIEFKGSREVMNNPQALCPSRNTSMEIVKEIIDQVMAVHKEFGDVSHLHIGGDEVYHLGECELCRVKSREDLFISHIKNVAQYIVQSYSGTRVIIWDDMLRQFSVTTMKNYGLGEVVEPMVWVYAEDVYRFVSPVTWEDYGQVFKRVWGASAFKGAFGETLLAPPLDRHTANNLAWVNVLNNEKRRFSEGVQGLVLTGWQRYDHYAVLCELLPTGIPSLVLNTLVIREGGVNAKASKKTRKALGCLDMGNGHNSEAFDLHTDRFLFAEMTMCNFPGKEVFQSVRRLSSETTRFTDLMSTQRKGWFLDFSIDHNYTSPSRVEEMKWQFLSADQELTRLVEDFRNALSICFDDHTVREYIEQKIWPSLKEIRRITNLIKITGEREAWESRPLPSDPEFLQVFKELTSTEPPRSSAPETLRKHPNDR